MTNNNKHKLFGIVLTIAFHAIALILLFTLCFRTPLPLPSEDGVEVNLGMSAQGLGEESYQDIEESTNYPIDNTQSTEDQQNQEVEESILSEDADVPSLEEVTEEIEQEKTQEEAVEEKQEEVIEEVAEEKPVVNQRAMFNPQNNKPKSSSEGNTVDGGDQGSPNGLKDIDRYDNNVSNGVGVSYDLGGRMGKNIPSPNDKIQKDGHIIVNIWVDKNGNVVRVEINGKSTISKTDYPSMHDDAIKAAKKATFVPDENATDLQKGTITFKYVVGV